jgi:hypothetical protein
LKAATQTAGCRPAAYFLVRTAGLPFAALNPFQGRRVLLAAERLDELSAGLEERRHHLCGRIFDLVHGQSDARVRRELLALKRAVYNSRPAANPLSGNGLGEVLSGAPEVATELQRWQERITERRTLLANAERDAVLDRKSAVRHLTELWQTTRFRQGILFAQPQLFRDLDCHLGAGARSAGGEASHAGRSIRLLLPDGD